MIVKYRVDGVIEINLNKYQIKELQSKCSETMKKAYLEEVLRNSLHTAENTAECECDININFDGIDIVCNWNKYAGNMKAKNEQYGSPLGITLDNFPTTTMEKIDNTIREIDNRKKNKKH